MGWIFTQDVKRFDCTFTEYDPEFGMGEHMFTDLALSRDTMKEFLSEKGLEHPSQKLSVMVLQQSVWPFSPRKHDINLPPSVSTP